MTLFFEWNAKRWRGGVKVFSLVLLVFACLPGASDAQDQPQDATPIQFLATPEGTRFGILGTKPAKPAPTLIVLSGTIERTLGDGYYLQSGAYLRKRGYLCVSIDLPCHGEERRADEPEGLTGWRARLDRGEDFVASFDKRLGHVVDYLIAERYSDPKRVAACGVSRGGYAALQFAAADERIGAVAAFAPVTDLGALREFETAKQSPRVKALALKNRAKALAGRPIWMCIGDHDHRVDTDAAITFARHVSAVSYAQGLPSKLQLIVFPEPRGHTVQPRLFKQAAQWIDDVLR